MNTPCENCEEFVISKEGCTKYDKCEAWCEWFKENWRKETTKIKEFADAKNHN